MDWLSSVRLHPVNDAVARIVQVLPLYWMGFNGAALAAFVPFLTFYALLLHANVDWSVRPAALRVASPVFHRWHHTTEEEGLDTNFAGLFPVHRPGVRHVLHAGGAPAVALRGAAR